MTKDEKEWQNQLEVDVAEAKGLAQGEFQGRVIAELKQLGKDKTDLYDKYNDIVREIFLMKGKAIGYSAVISFIIALIGIVVKWKA